MIPLRFYVIQDGSARNDFRGGFYENRTEGSHNYPLYMCRKGLQQLLQAKNRIFPKIGGYSKVDPFVMESVLELPETWIHVFERNGWIVARIGTTSRGNFGIDYGENDDELSNTVLYLLESIIHRRDYNGIPLALRFIPDNPKFFSDFDGLRAIHGD